MDPPLLSDHRWAVGAATALYVGAAIMLVAMAIPATRSAVQVVDDSWWDLAQSADVPVFVDAMKLLDVVGGVFVMGPLRVGISIWLIVKTRWAALATWLGAIVISEVAISILKPLYDRPRPPHPLVETSSASFPSGHAVAAAVTAFALVIVLFPPGSSRRRWEIAAGAFAFSMALSRTVLNAHWLSDVVTGFLIGAATAVGTAAVVQAIRTHNSDQRKHHPESPVKSDT